MGWPPINPNGRMPEMFDHDMSPGEKAILKELREIVRLLSLAERRANPCLVPENSREDVVTIFQPLGAEAVRGIRHPKVAAK